MKCSEQDVFLTLTNVARRSPSYYKHAAALYTKGGRLIVAAHNISGNHAEERVIRRYLAVDKFRQHKIGYLVVIRLTKGGHGTTYSAPCIKCQRTLFAVGVTKILHS